MTIVQAIVTMVTKYNDHSTGYSNHGYDDKVTRVQAIVTNMVGERSRQLGDLFSFLIFYNVAVVMEESAFLAS